MPFSKPVTGKGSGITMISMDQWFSKCESQTYSLASPGSLLEIQILATYPPLPPSNLLTERPWDEAHNLCLNKASR